MNTKELKQRRFRKLLASKCTQYLTRAFVVGAIVASRDGYASATALAHCLDISQSAISALVRRVELKVSNSALNLWEPSLYENKPGRGRKVLLSQEQKDTIIHITTQDCEHREQEPWQTIAHGYFASFVPKISVTTFENVIYKARYSRRRPR